MLIVESLELENFLSFKKAILRFNRSEPTLVIGVNKTTSTASSNGSGKTALFEALPYGLFGYTASGRHGDNAVHNFERDCLVRITGTSNGKSFVIERYRKHYKHKNNLYFKVDGVSIEGNSVKNTQKMLEQYLSIDYNLILQTCYFSPSSIRTFCGMTDSDQKGIFQALLNLDRWEEASSLIKGKITLLESNVTTIKADVKTLEAMKKKDLQQLAEQRMELTTIQIVVSPKEITDIEQDLEKIQQAKIKLKELSKKVNNCQQKLADTIADEKVLTREIQKKTELGETCEVCDQYVDKASIQHRIDSLESDLANLREVEFKLSTLLTHGRRRKTDLTSLVSREEALKVKWKFLKEHLKSNLKMKRARLAKITKLGKEINKVIHKLNSHKRTLDLINLKLQELKKLEIVFGTTGAKTYIMKEVIPYLNTSLVKYANILSPTVRIELDTQRRMTTNQLKNKFSIKVISKTGVDYKGLSSGEAKRVDLCIVFAFLDLIRVLGKSTNFIILDEILDNLDPVGEEMAINLLKNVDATNIFLISHKNTLQSRFSNVLCIEKSKDISSIIQDV